MQDTEAKQEKSPKPKYNMWQNAAYMISLAWREKEKKVLVLAFLSAVFTVTNSLVGLYVTPSILGAVESKVPIPQLIVIILVFVALLLPHLIEKQQPLHILMLVMKNLKNYAPKQVKPLVATTRPPKRFGLPLRI